MDVTEDDMIYEQFNNEATFVSSNEDSCSDISENIERGISLSNERYFWKM